MNLGHTEKEKDGRRLDSCVYVCKMYILHTAYHRYKSTQMGELGLLFKHIQEEAVVSLCSGL